MTADARRDEALGVCDKMIALWSDEIANEKSIADWFGHCRHDHRFTAAMEQLLRSHRVMREMLKEHSRYVAHGADGCDACRFPWPCPTVVRIVNGILGVDA